jgi:alanyl-tRNA synthetase
VYVAPVGIDVNHVRENATSPAADRFWRRTCDRHGISPDERVAVGVDRLDYTKGIVQRLDADMDELRATANALAADGKIAVLGSGADGAQFVVAVPDGVGVDAGDVVGELAQRVGGGGGGPPDFAQGGGPDADALDDALDDAGDVLRKVANV